MSKSTKKVLDFTKLPAQIHIQRVKRMGRGWEDGFLEVTAELEAHIAAPLHEKVQEIEDDRDLTDRGVSKRIRAASFDAIQQIEKAEKSSAGALRDRVAKLTAKAEKKAAYPKPTDPADRIAFELRQNRLVDSVKDLDSIQRLNLYFSIKDPEVREALETAPPILRTPTEADKRSGDPKRMVPLLEPVIDPDRVAEVRAARLRAAEPATADLIDDLTSMASIYSMILNTMKSLILDGMPAEEPEDQTPEITFTGDPVKDAGFIPGESLATSKVS